MTPFTAFDPGNELQCAACEMHCDGPDPCLLAVELADDGEVMTSHCCPSGPSCDVCGGPLPCRACALDLRCDP